MRDPKYSHSSAWHAFHTIATVSRQPVLPPSQRSTSSSRSLHQGMLTNPWLRWYTYPVVRRHRHGLVTCLVGTRMIHSIALSCKGTRQFITLLGSTMATNAKHTSRKRTPNTHVLNNSKKINIQQPQYLISYKTILIRFKKLLGFLHNWRFTWGSRPATLFLGRPLAFLRKLLAHGLHQ